MFPGGMGNMQAMMKKVQKMQADMAKMQEDLKSRTVETSVGGGAVTVVVSGKKELKSIKINPFLSILKFPEPDLKGKLRCNHPKCIDNPLQTFRSDHQQRFLPLCISHGKQHPRQATDVIRMIMGEADHINGIRAPALFFHCNLRSLTTIYQYALSLKPCHHGCQPPARQRHHPAGSQKTNV